MTPEELAHLETRVSEALPWIPQITEEMARVVVGQQYLVNHLEAVAPSVPP